MLSDSPEIYYLETIKKIEDLFEANGFEYFYLLHPVYDINEESSTQNNTIYISLLKRQWEVMSSIETKSFIVEHKNSQVFILLSDFSQSIRIHLYHHEFCENEWLINISIGENIPFYEVYPLRRIIFMELAIYLPNCLKNLLHL